MLINFPNFFIEIDSLLPITPGGGDANKNVEYVYLGCSSSTDISTAKLKFKLSTPNPDVSSFGKLYTLNGYRIGELGNEFAFTNAGMFFISSPLATANQIKVHTLKGYRTGGLSIDNLINYEIFCDKDNNILYTAEKVNIVGNNAPVFWAVNTNVPTE